MCAHVCMCVGVCACVCVCVRVCGGGHLRVERVTGIRAPSVLLELEPLALERFIMCSRSQGSERRQRPPRPPTSEHKPFTPAEVYSAVFIMERSACFSAQPQKNVPSFRGRDISVLSTR